MRQSPSPLRPISITALAVGIAFSGILSGPASEAHASTSTLTWSAPRLYSPITVQIDEPGTYRMDSRRDYRIVSRQVIKGPVVLMGGRNVVWVGGEISIPEARPGQAATARRALVVVDHDENRGDPARNGGASRDGRVVHIEGLRIGGPGLAEGINTNAPATVVQLQNINVDTVSFQNGDDRDGVNGWPGKNHPDVIQTWGSQKELRIDGLTGRTAYQGIFLKEDAEDAVHGKVYLRRVDITATSRTGTDGLEYAGHRTFSHYPDRVGTVHVDDGTVRMTHHVNSGWTSRQIGRTVQRSFSRTAYLDPTTGRHVHEPPPRTSTFFDTLGDTPSQVTTDASGTWGAWNTGKVVNWRGTAPGKIYSNEGATTYVPQSSVGLTYRSPGYMKSSVWRTSRVG